MARFIPTIMADPSALYRLLTWLSPSYPVGAYTYSNGLEQAVEVGWITNADKTQSWIRDVVTHGAGLSDTIFLLEAMRGDLCAVVELASAFVATEELALETMAQGKAFLRISRDVWPSSKLDELVNLWDGPYPYPVVVGCLAASHNIDQQSAALAYLHAFSANLISAAVRLVPLGQTDGQRITAALEPVVTETVDRAMACSLEDAANSSWMTDICSMRHETQHTRLFRS